MINYFFGPFFILWTVRFRPAVAIVRGSVAEQKNFPYFVTSVPFACGGVLVAPRVVLTAAHCQYAFRKYVEVGKYSKVQRGQYVEIDNKIPHPRYNNVTFDFDIMIVTLKNKVTKVPMNKMPLISGKKNNYNPDHNWLIMGLGTTSYGSRNLPVELRNATVHYESRCQYPYWSDKQVTDRMLCAKGTSRSDACQFDDGGPMVYEFKNRVILIGIISWGSGCGGASPGVYANVGEFAQWIKSQTRRYAPPPRFIWMKPRPPKPERQSAD